MLFKSVFKFSSVKVIVFYNVLLDRAWQSKQTKRFSKHLLSRFQSNLCRLLKIFFSIFQIVLFFLHEWPFFYFLYIEFEKFLEPKLLKYCDDISYSNCQGSNNIYCLTFGNLSRICHRNISTT